MDFDRASEPTVSELLERLPNLTERVLQQEYLDRAESTELLISAIALLNDESQAIRIVELTWEINKKYAARLAGAAHPQVQQQTVERLKELIARSVIGLNLQIRLLAETASRWVVKDLIEFFKSRDSYAWREAYYALKKMSEHKNYAVNTSIGDFLIERLKGIKSHQNPDTLAIDLLGDIGDARALPILLRHFQNPELWVQRSVAAALGKIGSPEVFEPLSIALQNTSKDKKYVSRCAAKSLGLLGDDRAVKPLMQALGDFSYLVRWGATEALAIIGTEEAIDAVIKLVEDEIRWVNRISPCVDEDEIRWVNRVSPKTGEWIHDDRQIYRWERGLQNHQSYAHKGKIDRLNDKKYKRLIEVVFTAIGSQDRSLRERAGSVLLGISDDRAIEPLIHLLQTGNDDARAKSAEILGKIGSIQAFDSLIIALNDRSSYVRYHAVSALGTIGDDRATASIIKVLKQQDYYTFRCAVFALAKINSPQAIEGLTLSIQYSHHGFYKIIAQGLGMTGDELAIDSLKILLQDDSDRVRMSAASSLGNIDSHLVIEPLSNALHDRYWQVRQSAFKSLLQISDDRENMVLLTCCQSRFYNVRLLAMQFTFSLNSQVAIAELKNSLQCSKKHVRLNATYWLAKIVHTTTNRDILDRAIELLITASHDRHSSVRHSATTILGRIPVQYTSDRVIDEAANALTIIAASDRSDFVRTSAIASIALIGRERSS
jgi:HEAT repeat protein